MAKNNKNREGSMDTKEWYEDKIKEKVNKAIKKFWELRDNGHGVRAGKTMDPFLEIFEEVVKMSSLESKHVTFFKSGYDVTLPGYYRPHKKWDLLALYKDKLFLVIELKSQVGSIGNNANNRAEEAIGSGYDISVAIEESVFGESTCIFKGYMFLAENHEKANKNTRVLAKRFPVMKEFLAEPERWGKDYKKRKDGTYPLIKGVSYLKRYDILCRRLVHKNVYDGAALIVANRDGTFKDVSPDSSLETFLMKIKGHCDVVASRDRQSQGE